MRKEKAALMGGQTNLPVMTLFGPSGQGQG